MNLPDGRLVKSRVVESAREPLAAALDRELTGYAVLESQEALLFAAEGRGVLTFREGVPVLAYHTGSDRGGPAALADLAAPGPYHAELYALESGALDRLDEPADLTVPPGMPAERLAGDPALAASTRRAAPPERRPERDRGSEEETDRDPGAVEAFLDDEGKVEAIREQAREEAKRRAEEWGFD